MIHLIHESAIPIWTLSEKLNGVEREATPMEKLVPEHPVRFHQISGTLLLQVEELGLYLRPPTLPVLDEEALLALLPL